MSSIKTVLISQFPLPYPKIASWTTMYNYLLKNHSHSFNYIICPKVESKAKNISYEFIRDISIIDKAKGKFIDEDNRYSNYIEALENIIEPNEKYVIHIVDNSGIIIPIDSYLKEKHNRKNFYIQYYYQGFAPLYKSEKGQQFLYAVDEFLFLSQLSYKTYLEYYDDFTPKARVVYNATDSKKFKKIDLQQKQSFREELDIDKKDIVFLWCSQDRPKKGLHIVLEAFKKVNDKYSNTKLLIVGINRKIKQNDVHVVGRVPNHQLPKYYQLSDVYLFPSLWKEGFGIVLAEALKCGCYCIASKQGAIPEVLKFGEYGVLIENPNFIDEWVSEMIKSIDVLSSNNTNPFFEVIPENIYDIEDWCKHISLIIDDAKENLSLHNNE